MALDHLLTALEHGAEAEAAALVDAARAEAEGITVETAARLAGERERRRAAGEARLADVTARAVAQARRRTRAAVLKARQRMLDRVFAAAELALRTAEGAAAFLARLPDDLAEARSYLPAGRARVHCRPALRARVRRLTRGDAALSVEPDPDSGTGLRLVAADGSVEVDLTLETRLAQLRPVLALELLRLVGGGK